MKAKSAFLALLVLAASVALAEPGAKYLIIAYDSYVGVVQPLANWKTRKGTLAKVVPVSEIGANSTAIQTYIRNAYNTWPVRPEFVLLVGQPSQIPAYANTHDCYYGNMTGDFKMEISVGRLPATTARECSTMVNKILAYERPSFIGDTTWFLRATTCVREDANDTFYWGDSRFAHRFWQGRGYQMIDSFSMNRGHNSSNVNAAAADGRAFITYRGQGVGTWWSPFNAVAPNGWNNGGELPVVVGGTCATITMSPGESMYGDQFVRAGSPLLLGGAVAYFGTTGSISSGAHYRSAVYRGFFNALYDEKEYRLGPATLRGRFRVDSLYHVQARYEEWNLLGDPDMGVWTGMPQKLVVQYDSVVPMAPQTFTVTVTAQGGPVPGAQVCVWMDSVVYAVGTTSGSGQVGLPINPTHVGTMSVTVTGSNLLPFEGTGRVMVSNAPYLVVAGTVIDDFVGNHDRVVNPGERFRMTVSLRNLGGATATGVTALLRIADPVVTVYDSTAYFGVVMPESTVVGEPFDLAVDSSTVEGQVVSAVLKMHDSEGDSWACPIDIVVRAGRLGIVSVQLLDSPPFGNGNGRLGAGESGRLELRIANSGRGNLSGVIGVLACLDSNVVITDSLGFYGPARAGETLAGRTDRFGVTAGPGLARNQPVQFRVRLSGDGGTYHYADTFSLEVPGEQGSVGEPTGPDAYGYWCYDDTDVESGRAPVYDWLELAPPGPGEVIPAVSDSDAATRTLAAPFLFRYYGNSDNLISVCSNGWLCQGYTTSRTGYNRPIPDTAGPASMIAPFWDDLDPDESRGGYGTAYQYHDTANHRWIVEFKEFAHINQGSIRETFQAILYDPAFHPTPTGDGDIIFQYNRVSLNSGCTVGIEDNTETRGIQYLYNNVHAPTAAYVQSGRALRFTTWPPCSNSRPWLVLVSFRISDSLYGNNNGFAEPGETLTVSVLVRNSGSATASSVSARVRVDDGEGVLLDSSSALPDLPVGAQAGNQADPFIYAVTSSPADSIIEMTLILEADGYASASYFSFGLAGVQSVTAAPEPLPVGTVLMPLWPNPTTGCATVQYGLARAMPVDLALFDPTGRRVMTIVRAGQTRGWWNQSLAVHQLPPGVYFCRLATPDARLVRKIQVAR